MEAPHGLKVRQPKLRYKLSLLPHRKAFSNGNFIWPGTTTFDGPGRSVEPAAASNRILLAMRELRL
ncbi:MAG: hypothetical protein DMG96_04375 [Acidobacteria bacterium]|nr:MAG: hypothetical protein DMG98_01355 [Acidobacteriota bacterium]PYV79354.1 MAG: hypothetical protein DMG96_04375 [Acidobacteriota bacterium]